MLQPGRIRFSREWPIAADDRTGRKVTGQAKAVENLSRGGTRFIGQYCQRRATAQLFEHLFDPRIGACMRQEMAIVDREKPIERVGRPFGTTRRKGARNERRCALADHPADLIFGKRIGAARFENRVGGVGDVAARVDERAVEVENDQTEGMVVNG
jgi:hypothetical protein